MIITFLGTGGSQGIPVIACECDVCKSVDSKDKRLRTSVLIEINDKAIVIDSGPDFRQQLLKENVNKLDAILFTHGHKDHTAGLDEVRSYNYIFKKPMDIYLETNVLDSIKKEFSYIFENPWYAGVPKVNTHIIGKEEFYIDDIKIIPIRLMHLQMPILGFRINDFTYMTDVNSISTEDLYKVRGSNVLVVNALRKKRHISHFNLEQALEIVNEIKPQKAYLIHMSHQMGFHENVQKELPDNVFLAYDGLTIKL